MRKRKCQIAKIQNDTKWLDEVCLSCLHARRGLIGIKRNRKEKYLEMLLRFSHGSGEFYMCNYLEEIGDQVLVNCK